VSGLEGAGEAATTLRVSFDPLRSGFLSLLTLLRSLLRLLYGRRMLLVLGRCFTGGRASVRQAEQVRDGGKRAF